MTTRNRGPVTILALSGSLTRSQGRGVLSERIWQLTLAGSQWILIDMAGLTSIDCFGMGDLITALAAVRTAGGEMKLVNVGNVIKRLLQLTRLDTIIEIHDDEWSATRTFSPHHSASPAETPSECFVG